MVERRVIILLICPQRPHSSAKTKGCSLTTDKSNIGNHNSTLKSKFWRVLKKVDQCFTCDKKSFRRLSWTLFFGLAATDGYVVSQKLFSPRQSSVLGVKSIYVMMYLGKQDSMVQTSVSLDQKSDKTIGASWPGPENALTINQKKDLIESIIFH